MSRTWKIGVAGLGTVGGGLLKFLAERPDFAPAGGRAVVTGVSARSRSRQRDFDISSVTWFDDPVALASSPDIDVFVELIGGSEGPAKAAVERLRHRQAGADQRRRHQLGVGGEGQGMPADEAALDRFLEPAHGGSRLGFEVVEDQPGASGPDEGRARRVLVPEVRCRVDRLRDEALVILAADLLGMVGKADIEMRLEDEMDGLGHGQRGS